MVHEGWEREKSDQNFPVNLPYPGRRTRTAVRILKTIIFTLLTALSFAPGLPAVAYHPPVSSGTRTDTPADPRQKTNRDALNLRNGVVAGPVPNLALPQTLLSQVDKLVDTGGIIRSSPDNLTLYNGLLSVMLLGGVTPHEEIANPDGSGPSFSTWMVEVQTLGGWLPLIPRSNNFTVLDTNSTGSFVVRSTRLFSASHSGTLKTVYKAMASGPLKWDLEFSPEASGHYRLVYTWRKLGGNFELMQSSKQFRVSSGSSSYTFAWDDVPSSFNTTTRTLPGQFLLSIDLGKVDSGSFVRVDPTLSTSSSPLATAYTFQRRVFYEPSGGRYWAFYYEEIPGVTVGIRYKSSIDGINWVGPDVAGGEPESLRYGPRAAIFVSGKQVWVADGDVIETTDANGFSQRASIDYSVGTFSGGTISWGLHYVLYLETDTCPPQGGGCVGTMLTGTRNVSVLLTSSRIFFAYNRVFSRTDGGGNCGALPHRYSESALKFYNAPLTNLAGGTWTELFKNSLPQGSCYRYDLDDEMRPVLVPADGHDGVRIFYEYPRHTYTGDYITGTTIEIASRVLGASQDEIVATNAATDAPQTDTTKGWGTPEFSALSDTDFGAHMVYKTSIGTVNYEYRSASPGSAWTLNSDIFSGLAAYPTVTLDYNSNDVYAFAVQGSSIVMRSRALTQSWTDRPAINLVTGRTSPAHLGSDLVSVGGTNASRISIVWTEGSSPPFSVTYVGFPIESVWSAFASPTSPWDGYGIAPFGEYFQNLGEYVSPSSGLLSIRQTDLIVPGRGVNLEIARVYSEPYSFLNNNPYDYESYTWAPLGNGWQLDFPWMSNTPKPLYVHLSAGQGYRIPYSFWTNATGTFENHRGEHFRLERYSNGNVTLYTKSGLSYRFASATHALRKVVDVLGNSVTFAYSVAGDRILSMNDTVNRNFLFCYTGNFLTSIDQANGTCETETGFVRRISYGNNGQSLANVTDPGQRLTRFQYASNPWLVSGVTYSTGWSSSYVYTQYRLGTEALVYTWRVTQQSVNPNQGPIIRRFDYTYTQSVGDFVKASTVKAYNGTSTQPASYTDYAFSYAGMTRNVSDANRRLVQGVQELFGVTGEVIKEIVLVTSLNVWYWTKTQPGTGWNSLVDWPLDTWRPAPKVKAYTNSPWGMITGWKDIDASWIWWNPDSSVSSTVDTVWFRTAFYTSKNPSVMIEATADDNLALYLDGIPLPLQNYDWHARKTYNTTLTQGYHVIGVSASNYGGSAGLLLSIRNLANGEVLLRTDASVGSYTNYYQYDNWGNQIYSRVATGYVDHESFRSFLNTNGQNKFLYFLEDFQLDGGTYYENPWQSTGLWRVEDGEYVLTGNVGTESKVEFPHTDGAFQVKMRFIRGDNFMGYLAFRYQNNGDHYAVYLSPATTQINFAGLRLSKFVGGQETILFASPVAYVANRTYTIRVESSASTHTVFLDGIPKMTVSEGTLMTGQYLALGTLSILNANSAPETIRFDDFEVQPLPSLFSNNFLSSTVNANVHNRLAGWTGPAEFSFGSSWIKYVAETYYAYDPFGDITNGKQRYDSSTGLRWITTTIAYDSYGNVKSQTDPKGNIVYYEYSSQYGSAYLTNATQIVSSAKVTQLFTYDLNFGYLLTSKDPRGNTTSYQYDILGRVTRASYPLGGFVQYSYEDHLNYVNATNTNQWKSRQFYDGLGRLTTRERFLGQTSYKETYAYDWMNRVTKTTDPMGRVSRFQYDVLGRPALVTKSDGNITRVDYNGVYPSVRTIDEEGNVKFKAYDFRGRLISVTEPATSASGHGAKTYYWYDGLGNLQQSAFNNQVTLHSYDSLGRLNRTNYPDQTAETYTYDDNGNLATKLDRKAVQTAYSYDPLNRLTTVTYPAGTITPDTYTYDTNGNLLQLQSQNATITYSYDARNRILSETYRVNGGGLSASFTYSPSAPSAGSPVTFTATVSGGSAPYSLSWSFGDSSSGTGNPVVHTYSVGGTYTVALTVTDASSTRVTYYQTVKVSSGGGGSVAQGTLITLSDRRTVPVETLRVGMRLLSYNTTTSQYTESRVIRLETVHTDNMLIIKTEEAMSLRTDNATAQNLWVRRADGSIGWLSVTRLRVGDYLFVALDQRWTVVKDITYVPGSFTMYDIYTTAPYNYVANGYLDPQKERPTGPTGSITITTTGGVGRTYKVSFTYNGDALDTVTYPDGLLVKYGYDRLGRVANVTRSGTTTYYARFSYNPDDSLMGVQYGIPLIANYTYNNLGVPATITLKDMSRPTPITLLSLTYGYNRTGTVASVTGTTTNTSGSSLPVNEQYRYDSLGRLTNSTVTAGSTTTSLWYEYDKAGNRARQGFKQGGASSWTVTTYAYNVTNNELTSYSGPSSVSYTYDPNGNQITRTEGTSRGYAWDPVNQLVKTTSNGAVVGAYAYDGFGRRVESVEGTTNLFYAYLGTETLAEYYSTGKVTDYVYAAGLRIANVTAISSVNYYHTDHLGSTRLVTSGDPTTVKVLFSDSYQPFGQDNGTPSCTGTCQTYKFTGKPWSSGSQLQYYFHRWYDPATGRFISHDPLPGRKSSPQSLNPYVYVRNIPTSLVDPSGESQVLSTCSAHSGCQYTPAINDFLHQRALEEESMFLAFLVLATVATGGTDLLAVGALGFGIGAGGYTGYAYATGGTPTLSGALFWGTIGFTAATAVASLPSIGPRIMGGLGLRGAEVAGETVVGGIYDIGPGVRIRPLGPPGGVVRAFNVDGELSNIGLYSGKGQIVERIDLLGRLHKVGLPHVVEYRWSGELGYKMLRARAANSLEQEIIEFLSSI